MTPRLRRRVLFLIPVMAILFLTPASPVRAEVLTLKDCLDIAARNSWSILKAEEDVVQAEWQLRQAKTEFYPKLSTSYSYAHLSPLSSINFGGTSVDVGYADNYAWNIKAVQPLFTGFKLITNRRLKELGLDVSQIALIRAKQDLALAVKQAYYQVLLAEKGRLVAEQAVKLLESQVHVAKNFYQVGMIPKNDLLQVEVDLADRRQKLVLAENSVHVAKARLNTVMRRDVQAPIEIEDVLDIIPASPDFEASLRRAYRQRPELKQAQKAVDIAQQGIKLAEADYYPALSFSASYERERDEPWVWGAGTDGNREVTTLALSFEWTFWEWNKTRYAVAEQRSALLKARHTMRELKDAIALEVKNAILNLKAAQKNIGVAKLAVAQAEENYRISEERYKEQVTTSTEVLDAQTRLSQARLNYYAALYEHHLALAQLKRSMGEM